MLFVILCCVYVVDVTVVVTECCNHIVAVQKSQLFDSWYSIFVIREVVIAETLCLEIFAFVKFILVLQ